MKQSTTAAIAGVAVAMAAGTAAYMAANHHRSSKSPMKKLKKNAGKAMRAVGDAIDNVSYMMK